MTTAEHPPMSLVKEPSPSMVEGTVVEHQGGGRVVEARPRPAWTQSAEALRQHALYARDNALDWAGHHVAHSPYYVGWSVRGYRRLGRRWLDAHHDHYPQMIGSIRQALRDAAGDPAAETKLKAMLEQRREEYRRAKRIHWAKSGGWTLAAVGGVGTGAVFGGLWVQIFMAIAFMAVGARHGRPASAVTEAPLLDGGGVATSVAAAGPMRDAVMSVDQLVEGKVPFPVAVAKTPEELAECVLRAMLAEGVPVVEVADVVRHPWGWQCVVRVSSGTPEAIIKVAGALETRFDLPMNGVRPQPMVERRACAILRLVEGDPFASAPGLPYRAPKSISIKDKSRVGTSIGGEPLDIALAGVMGLFVAASGGGKTGLLQALGEVATACDDNITIDLDPHGDGLEDLHDAVRITARTHQQIEAVLLFLLMLSKARARLRKKLGMGKKWDISPEHPAFTAIFDEFPKASDLAKRLAFELLLVGRKEAVSLQIASQGGTKLYLGENIAQMIAMKVVGPCKVGDTRAVFGDGAVAEGWLPHRLSPATDTDPKDAGHIYIQGVPGRADEPIEYKIHEMPAEALKKIASERLAAGLVEPDQTSLDAMAGVDLPDIDGLPELLTWEQLLKLCGATPPAGAAAPDGRAATALADAVDLMTKAGVDRMRTEVLTDALVDYDAAYADLTPDALKALFREAGAGSPVPLGVIDGQKNPRGFKRDVLFRARGDMP
ncbi:hypothetical protein ABZ951_00580 [Streptomyces sp. NPDC046215]|uniref:hypothetical protein n=1 Tax=Streptomyces TaxID=1883 RepID=UPI0031E3DE8F